MTLPTSNFSRSPPTRWVSAAMASAVMANDLDMGPPCGARSDLLVRAGGAPTGRSRGNTPRTLREGILTRVPRRLQSRSDAFRRNGRERTLDPRGGRHPGRMERSGSGLAYRRRRRRRTRPRPRPRRGRGSLVRRGLPGDRPGAPGDRLRELARARTRGPGHAGSARRGHPKPEASAALLARAGAALRRQWQGSVARIGAAADDLDDLGRRLAQLAPGIGRATVLTFLRPLPGRHQSARR